MARVSPVDPPYSDEVLASFRKLMPPGMEPLRLFRTLAHNPRVLRRIQRGGLLDPGSISTRLRELVILRTCARCRADYEWGVHAALFAGPAGFSERELAALAQASSPVDTFSADEDRLALRLADALHERARIDDALWRALTGAFDSAQLLELVTLAGLYHAVSFIVNVTGVEDEPWSLSPARAVAGGG